MYAEVSAYSEEVSASLVWEPPRVVPVNSGDDALRMGHLAGGAHSEPRQVSL